MVERVATFTEFWPHYLNAHRDRRTRAMHYLGTTLGSLLLLAFIASGNWRLLVAAPIAGYACAWIGHGFFEGNRPATFGHPLWSFYGDFRMLFLWATGRLGAELARVRPFH